MKTKLVVSICVLLSVLISNESFALKKKPWKRARTSFTTDWNNTDSLKILLEQKIAAGEYLVAVQITDSLIVRSGKDIKTIADLYEIKVLLLNEKLAKRVEAERAVVEFEAFLSSRSDVSGENLDELISLYESVANYDSASRLRRIRYEREIALLRNEAVVITAQRDSLDQLLVMEHDVQKGYEREVDELSTWLIVIVSAFSLVTLILILVLILRERNGRKRSENLREQMDHTRGQIEKAFEEEERITADIRQLREQVSRIEWEKNNLKKNIRETTQDTFPLLRSQLEALARESKDAIPVDKFMQLQNTITRINKQLKDLTE